MLPAVDLSKADERRVAAGPHYHLNFRISDLCSVEVDRFSWMQEAVYKAGDRDYLAAFPGLVVRKDRFDRSRHASDKGP